MLAPGVIGQCLLLAMDMFGYTLIKYLSWYPRLDSAKPATIVMKIYVDDGALCGFLLVSIIVAAVFVPVPSVLAASQARSSIPSASGSLLSYISTVETNVLTSGYVMPTDSQIKSFKWAASTLLAAIDSRDLGVFSTAYNLALKVKYEIVNYTDTSTGRYHYVLREVSTARRGYGIFILNSDLSSRSIVEVPHPKTDTAAGSIGIRSYVDSAVRAFLMAGVKRNAGPGADAAHTAQSFFEAMHELLVSGQSMVVQVHGFSQSNHPGYPDAVIGSGTLMVTPTVTALRDAFILAGFYAGTCDDPRWRDLAGTENVQGKFVVSVGGTFVHVELSLTMRTTHQDQTVDILSDFSANVASVQSL